jgi:hypothetical protein
VAAAQASAQAEPQAAAHAETVAAARAAAQAAAAVSAQAAAQAKAATAAATAVAALLNLRLEAVRFSFLAVLVHLAKLVIVSEQPPMIKKAVGAGSALYKSMTDLREARKPELIAHEARLGAPKPLLNLLACSALFPSYAYAC